MPAVLGKNGGSSVSTTCARMGFLSDVSSLPDQEAGFWRVRSLGTSTLISAMEAPGEFPLPVAVDWAARASPARVSAAENEPVR